MLFTPGSLSVIACPAQRQSGEAVRRVREILLKIGVELKSDHVYGLELKNGSRVLALPGSEDSIRGLTVDGLIVADEAARLSEAIFASLRPMRARRRLGQMMIRHGLYRSFRSTAVVGGDSPYGQHLLGIRGRRRAAAGSVWKRPGECVGDDLPT